jgi:group I intron endonuclease
MSNKIVEKKQRRKSVDYQNGKIYMIVNSINDKIYIGSCATELRIRFSGHKKNAKNITEKLNSNRIFYDFLRDNVDKFKIILIENCPCNSKNELERREYQIIQEKLKELGRDKLYNASLAQSGEGHHFFGVKFTEEHTSNLSNSIKNAHSRGVVFMKGKKHTIETKQKMSAVRQGETHHMYGKTHTEEIKKQISEKMKGQKHPQFKGGCIRKRKHDYIILYVIYDEHNIKQSKSRCFSFKKHGSKENAYKACLEFQKSIYPELNNVK